MKKTLASLLLSGLLLVSGTAHAQDPLSASEVLGSADFPGNAGTLSAARFSGWMAEYLSRAIDARSTPAYSISTRIVENGSGDCRVMIDGYVNLTTEPGIDYVSRILPERLDVVKAYFAYWTELGYDVDFDRDVLLNVQTVYGRRQIADAAERW